ncbi:uncharacterized protein EV154DRAFT_479588 [Mucor mucedo]|uniref:uncharacterized protein n=1 Tax=Mucor mucedo TaxID=29922 RepID=UPI0022212AD2|nr:uncharacterized protein EV154DRAFT_479588 [Mucor mucedo]KAI7893146.1 hypothetical protein EV154DRAFT_479588 [Mucor mucedo]
MTDRNIFKRKRVTSDILSYLPSRSETVHHDTNEDKIRQIQLRLERLETEKYNLNKQVECSKITHNLFVQESSQKITELITERNDFKALAIQQQKNAAESVQTLAVIKKEHINATEKLRSSLEGANLQVRQLKEELDQQEYTHSNYVVQNERQTSETQSQIEELVNMNDALKNDLQLQEARVEESTARELALIKRVSELESQATQSVTGTTNGLEDSITADYTHVCNKLAEIQTKDKKLEKELQHFKSLNQNIEYLREERNSLQERLKGLSDIENQKLSVDIENANLRAERDTWTRYLSTVPEYNHLTPGTIVYNLTKVADKADYLETKVTFLEKEMHDKTELVKLMEDHVRDVKDAILKKDRENALLCEENKLNSSRESMLKRHIDILQSQLRLYDEAEVAESETTYDEKKTQRISQLEELLRNLQNKFVEEGKLYIKALSMTFPPPVENGPYEKLTSGARITEFLENVYNDKESALEDFTEFKNEVKQHFSVNSCMHTRENEIPIKQEPVPSPARESYSSVAPIIKREQSPSPSPTQDIPAGTRVLSLQDNPASQMLAIRQDLLNRLQNENKDLIQLRLDENPNVDTVILPKTSITNLSKELDEFQAKRDALLKRIDRVHEVWNEKLTDIMAKVRDYLGYKFTLRNEGVIRIESVHVDEADLYFLVNEDNLLRIVGAKKDEYLALFSDIYQRYVVQERNIPAFLNAAALELIVGHGNQDLVHEASEDVSENVDSADAPEQMEVDRVAEYNDEEEGYEEAEESDHDMVEFGYESAQPVDTMDEDGFQAYEEGSSGSMSDDLEDDSAAEDELDYYESGDRESSYDDEDTPVPTAEPVEICLLDSDSE